MGSIKKKKQSKQGTHLRLTCSQLSFPVLFPSPALPSRPHCNPPPCGSRCYLFLLDPFLAYLAMEYPLTRMLSATLCSGSPRLKKNPRYLLFFSSVCVFLSKPSSAPLLLQSARMEPLTISMACGMPMQPISRAQGKGAPTYPRCCPAPLMLYIKKTKIPWLPKWGSRQHCQMLVLKINFKPIYNKSIIILKVIFIPTIYIFFSNITFF